MRNNYDTLKRKKRRKPGNCAVTITIPGGRMVRVHDVFTDWIEENLPQMMPAKRSRQEDIYDWIQEALRLRRVFAERGR